MEKVNRTVKKESFIPNSKFQNGVLIDSCVLYGLFDTKDSWHQSAQTLSGLCNRQGIKLWVPAHAFFEFNAIRLRKLKDDNVRFLETSKIFLDVIYIEETFMKRYLVDDLPYQKGADYIYMSIAHTEKMPLITEDKAFFHEEKKRYFSAYHIDEFVEKIKKEN